MANEGNPPAWTAQIPEDLRGNETLTQIPTIGDLAGAFLEKEGKLSELQGELEQSVRVPGDDASDDDWAALFNRLGRPESPDGYEFTRPELPEGIPYDEEAEAAFREEMHNLGLTKAQAEKLFAKHGEHLGAAFKRIEEARTQAHNEAVQALTQDWGGEEAFQANAELAIRAVEQFGGPELKQFLDQSGLGDNPMLIRAFYNIGKALSDDTFVPGASRGTAEKSPGEALYPDMKTGG